MDAYVGVTVRTRARARVCLPVCGDHDYAKGIGISDFPNFPHVRFPISDFPIPQFPHSPISGCLDFRISGFPDFPFQDFRVSHFWIPDFRISRFPISALPDSALPDFRMSGGLDFRISESPDFPFPDFRDFPISRFPLSPFPCFRFSDFTRSRFRDSAIPRFRDSAIPRDSAITARFPISALFCEGPPVGVLFWPILADDQKNTSIAQNVRRNVPDSVVTFFFDFGTPVAPGPEKGPEELVANLHNLINRLTYYVLQLGDPNQDRVLGPSCRGFVSLCSVSMWLFAFFCCPPRISSSAKGHPRPKWP